ncbi:MAG: hypothetical protein TREMPRED_002219 [Tremellales sp. Tagirdzhanova-0007]|nr:MAG: hypothetical protein TREMPRED_002219 [Tremellales sp. Tagirdzhanova-0007]
MVQTQNASLTVSSNTSEDRSVQSNTPFRAPTVLINSVDNHEGKACVSMKHAPDPTALKYCRDFAARMSRLWRENTVIYDMIQTQPSQNGFANSTCLLNGFTARVSESTEEKLGLPHGYSHFVADKEVFDSDQEKTVTWELNPHLSESELSEIFLESQQLEAPEKSIDEGLITL